MNLTRHFTVLDLSRRGNLSHENLVRMYSGDIGRMVRFRDEGGVERRGILKDILDEGVLLVMTRDVNGIQEHDVHEEDILGIEPLSKEKFMGLERD